MAHIQIISEEIVKAEKSHGELIDTIHLTPSDLRFLFVEPIQKGLLFRKPTPLDQETKLFANDIVSHLKLSFSRTLEFFPSLTGRLKRIIHEDDDTLSAFFIECNNKGASFIHAVVDNIAIDDILRPIYTPSFVHSFFPLNGMLNFQSTTKPLIAIQVNELVDGFFIGATINHVVCDGSSFWHFFNSWSEISRGSKTLSMSPLFKPWFPSEVDFPIHLSFPLTSLEENSSLLNHEFDEFSQTTRVVSSLQPTQLESRVFHFSKLKIATLKEKANKEMSTDKISSLQAVLAHVWGSIIRCQNLDPKEELMYRIPIDARPRLNKMFPKGYFGNAIHTAVVKTTPREFLQKEGLGGIAMQIHNTIASQTSDEIVKHFKNWASNPMLGTLSDLPRNVLLVSSSPKFNVYGTDFGWGKPLAARSGPGNKPQGMLTFFPGLEDGSMEIEVCLSLDKLIALQDDVNFMEPLDMYQYIHDMSFLEN